MANFPPLDALHDALGTLSAAGGIEPRNDAMRALLAGLSAPHLAALLPDAAVRAALLRGEDCLIENERGDSICRVANGWLIIAHRAHASSLVLAHARARALAKVAGSLVHDLANLMGAAIGVADALSGDATSAEDRQLLADLVDGVRRGSQLANTLERQLRAPAHRVMRANAAEVIDGLRSVISKVMQHRKMGLDMEVGEDLPDLRMDGLELTQVLLHAVFLGIALQASGLQLRVQRIDRDAESGSRAAVAFTMLAQQCAAGAQTVAATAHAASLADGALAAAAELPAEVRDVMTAVPTLLCRGGSVLALAQGADLRLTMVVPAAH